MHGGIKTTPVQWGKALLVAMMTGVILFAAIVIFGLIGLFRVATGTVALSEQFILALAGEDYAGAYALTSSQFQQATTQEGLQAFVADFPVIDEAEEVSISTRGTDEGMPYVAGTIISPAESAPFYMEFVREKGVLRILYLSLDPQDLPRFSDE